MSRMFLASLFGAAVTAVALTWSWWLDGRRPVPPTACRNDQADLRPALPGADRSEGGERNPGVEGAGQADPAAGAARTAVGPLPGRALAGRPCPGAEAARRGG